MTCEEINITIIGATKGLGLWIAKQLKNENYNVTITSRNKLSGEKIADKIHVNYSNDNIKSVENADIIIFSVPIEHMVNTIKEVAPYAPEGSLLVDISSVKMEPSEALKKYAPENTEILPCHPMFGPRIPSLDGQTIILTPIDNRCTTYYNKVNKFLRKHNAKIVVSTPVEHDQIMSVVQGLTHFSYISIASTIEKLGVSIKKSREFASPVYSLMLDMISRIVSQNPYLYYSIQKNNSLNSISRKMLIEESTRLALLVEKNEENEFVHTMRESAKHLDEFEEALGRSDKAINVLTHELNILKDSIGQEVGLKHQYSKNIHVGIIQDINNKEVILTDLKNQKIKLKISNIEILSEDEVFEWKKNNMTLHNFDVSVMFPITSNENTLLDMFNKIEPVVSVKIKEVYTGPQVLDNFKSITFHYTTFNKNDNELVINYLQGIGGIIR
ncbi:MAG: prephenate dehydrogenase [Methanosphaera stadtmanae]|nr:prephenate dehydrogenase [Methanosphaera stadtmanae]